MKLIPNTIILTEKRLESNLPGIIPAHKNSLNIVAPWDKNNVKTKQAKIQIYWHIFRPCKLEKYTNRQLKFGASRFSGAYFRPGHTTDVDPPT